MWKKHLDKKKLTVYKYEKIMKEEKQRMAFWRKTVIELDQVKFDYDDFKIRARNEIGD